MSLVAAFLWKKSPPSICTFVYDNESIRIISQPKIFFFSKKIFSFKKEAKRTINAFISDLQRLSRLHDSSIIIEYKIVFNVINIPWIKAAAESKFIYKLFHQSIHKLQNKIPTIKLNPQLRNKLSGRALIYFKRELRKMDLVSRKRDAHFEYRLWMIALHATSKSYKQKLQRLKQKLLDEYWNQSEKYE